MGQEYLENEEAEMGSPPICHFTIMEYEWADDVGFSVEYWVCKHCGHTKEICKNYRE